jgi:ribokinase
MSRVGKLLIITLGENGSVLFYGDRIKHILARKVDVVETTGAGDSYIGALATKLIEGEDYFLAAEFASKVSSVTVMGIGAQDAMPSLEIMKNLNL